MTCWHVDDPMGRWLEKFPETKVLVATRPLLVKTTGRWSRVIAVSMRRCFLS